MLSQPKWSAPRTRLTNKDQLIDRDTIRTNAEMLLRLFEQDVVKHVARTQADTKIMKALLCRDKAEELRDPAKYREVAGSRSWVWLFLRLRLLGRLARDRPCVHT